MAAPAPNSKWTVAASASETRKFVIPPPMSDNYEEWTLDQLKLECTARKLNIAKNTRKHERVSLLLAYDLNKDGVEALLRRQRKRSKETSEAGEKRTGGCMFRLLNILFSMTFVGRFLSLGNLLRRDEVDNGGHTFWTDVAVVFSSDTAECDTLISDDAVFEDVDTSVHMTHSAAKQKRMWKEVASNFAQAEANLKVSGQGSNDFWDICEDRSDVYYLDRWRDHRQAGREFCAANIYPDDEDDSTQEGKGRPDETNNASAKGAQRRPLLSDLSKN